MEAKPGGLRVGWASVDITPDEPVVLRGQFHARVSEGVMDPVTATTLAIESSETATRRITPLWSVPACEYHSGRSHMSARLIGPISAKGYEDHAVNLLFTWDRGKRLTGEVRQWSFRCWNEPDLTGFWYQGDV